MEFRRAALRTRRHANARCYWQCARSPVCGRRAQWTQRFRSCATARRPATARAPVRRSTCSWSTCTARWRRCLWTARRAATSRATCSPHCSCGTSVSSPSAAPAPLFECSPIGADCNSSSNPLFSSPLLSSSINRQLLSRVSANDQTFFSFLYFSSLSAIALPLFSTLSASSITSDFRPSSDLWTYTVHNSPYDFDFSCIFSSISIVCFCSLHHHCSFWFPPLFLFIYYLFHSPYPLWKLKVSSYF